MSNRFPPATRQLDDLLGSHPGQQRRSFGRVREGRYLRPGLRPLARDHAICPRRTDAVILPGWTDDVLGRC